MTEEDMGKLLVLALKNKIKKKKMCLSTDLKEEVENIAVGVGISQNDAFEIVKVLLRQRIDEIFS